MKVLQKETMCAYWFPVPMTPAPLIHINGINNIQLKTRISLQFNSFRIEKPLPQLLHIEHVTINSVDSHYTCTFHPANYAQNVCF